MIEFKLPSLGADMDEGKLLEWKVRPGDTVKKGQVLCIIEAMKLMNEIESDVAGMFLVVLAEDGAPVEYDQPLFKIAVA